jgi:hypothetical protein
LYASLTSYVLDTYYSSNFLFLIIPFFLRCIYSFFSKFIRKELIIPCGVTFYFHITHFVKKEKIENNLLQRAYMQLILKLFILHVFWTNLRYYHTMYTNISLRRLRLFYIILLAVVSYFNMYIIMYKMIGLKLATWCILYSNLI